MDFRLTEQEKMLREAAREFADRSIRPRAREIDSSAEFPEDIAAEMGRLGFFGLAYPREYGGSASGWQSYALVIEQLAQALMVCGAIVAIESLYQQSVACFGSEAQKQKYLAPVVRGEKLGCFGFTEPATGSDPRAISARATPQGDGYGISGEKNFVALSPYASFLVTFARDDSGKVTAFLVDLPSPGATIEKPISTLGLRGTGVSPVHLDGVRVPHENLLGRQGDGYRIMVESIATSKMGLSGAGLGVAQEALNLAIGYARKRLVAGKALAGLLSIQYLLAEMASQVEALRWLVYHTASLLECGDKTFLQHSAMTKLRAAEAACQVTGLAMQVHGAYGFTTDFAIERLCRDARVLGIIEGSSEIQRTIIANGLLG